MFSVVNRTTGFGLSVCGFVPWIRERFTHGAARSHRSKMHMLHLAEHVGKVGQILSQTPNGKRFRAAVI